MSSESARFGYDDDDEAIIIVVVVSVVYLHQLQSLACLNVADLIDNYSQYFWGGSVPGRAHRKRRFHHVDGPDEGSSVNPNNLILRRARYWMSSGPEVCRSALRVTVPVLEAIRAQLAHRLDPEPGAFNYVVGWAKCVVALYALGSRAERRVVADIFACGEQSVATWTEQFVDVVNVHWATFILFSVEKLNMAADAGARYGFPGCMGQMDGRRFPAR